MIGVLEEDHILSLLFLTALLRFWTGSKKMVYIESEADIRFVWPFEGSRTVSEILESFAFRPFLFSFSCEEFLLGVAVLLELFDSIALVVSYLSLSLLTFSVSN